MKIFFIRNIHTKLYFPEPKGRRGRGGSFTEANNKDDNARIFRSELSAKRFLGEWLKGEYHRSSGIDPGHPGNDWEPDYWEEIYIKPKANRKREDYEIILKEIDL